MSSASTDLIARVQVLRDKVWERQENDRRDYRAENPELFAYVQTFLDQFPGSKKTYFRDRITGRQWGKPMPGIAVTPCIDYLARSKKK